jgi:transporter family-2 protein
MTGLIIVVVVGLMGGVAAGLQGPLASLMGKQIGIMGSIFVIHLGGAAASAALLLVPRWAKLGAWRAVPWYALGAGVLGLILVGALSYCIPKIGAASTITLIIVVQLVVGSLLDHFGVLVEQARPFEPSRMIGVAVLLLGTWLVVR